MGAETRSSTSTTATLKDFVLATFGSCTSSIVTTARDGSGGTITGPLSIGTGSVSVSDSATVTVGGAATWTGTVQFYLCGPIASGSCDGMINVGTAIGAAQTVNQSTPEPVSSAAASVTSVGNYCWRATFTSGTNGVPNASDDGSGTSPNPECFSVTPVQPTLTTQASGPVQLGSAISDTATLTGTANRPGSPIINPTTAGAAAGGTITSAGGSALNGSVTLTLYAACPDTTGTETVLVTDTTGVTTAQNWLPNDSATITSAGGSALNGSVTLTLYDNGTCNGNVLYTTGAMAVSGSSPQTRTSSNTTVKVSASTTVSWLASYTSNDPNVAGSSSHCETTSLVINN